MTLKINGTDIYCDHEIKLDKAFRPSIHVTVSSGETQLTHVLNIGTEDEPLPATYTAENLQADLDRFRQKMAEHLEGKIRAKRLADSVK